MPIFFCGQIRKVHMEKARGLRKGAWTYEEDNLLKACIHKYGEGKWHLVPKRTGLNRCRKSCRLRWLNYLNPAINRESFAEDEIDMILRLHKLLGNKWSLIAARLPGRTANDVKNYWHTNLRKKVIPRKEEKEEKEKSKESMIKSHEVIKPRPRTFSTHSLWLKKKHNFVSNGSATKLVISSEDGNVPRECDKTTLPNLIDSSSSHSPWLKKNHSLPTTLMASREDVNIPRECDKTTLPNIGDAQTCVGNDPSSTTWWESLLNMDEERSNEKIDSSSLLPKENFTLEFSNVEDFFNNGPTVSDFDWDSNLCDFNFFGVFN